MRDALVAGLGAAALALAVVVLAVGIRDSGGAAPRATAAPADESGRAVFVRMGCGSCHTLAAASSGGASGPTWTSASRATRASP